MRTKHIVTGSCRPFLRSSLMQHVFKWDDDDKGCELFCIKVKVKVKAE